MYLTELIDPIVKITNWNFLQELNYKKEVNNMKTEKKELIKKFKVVVEDLLDNYEKYTDEEKAQIKDLFQKVADLNAILDKYDIKTKYNWTAYLDACSQYFDVML